MVATVLKATLKLHLPVGCDVRTVAWRQCAESRDGHQVLVFTSQGVFPLEGVGDGKDFTAINLAPQLRLECSAASAPDAPAPWTQATCSASDGSHDICFATETAVWQLNRNNQVHRIAGNASARPAPAPVPRAQADALMQGGRGYSATFVRITHMEHGHGSILYVLDRGRLRVIERAPAFLVPQEAPFVGTLQHEASSNIVDSIAYDHSNNILYCGLFLDGEGRVYRYTEPIPQQGTLRLEQWAPAVNQPSTYSCFVCMQTTARGDVLAIDSRSEVYGERLENDSDRFITLSAPDGHQNGGTRNVHTCSRFTALPLGGIALYRDPFTANVPHNYLWLWSGDEKPSRAVPYGEPFALRNPGRVCSDVAAFQRDPSVPPDVTVLAGGRAFPAHRLVLIARSPHLAALLSNSGASELELPGVDPAAFEQLLSYMYGGELRPSAACLRPLAELADRLVLGEASAHLQRQLVAAASPGSVVGDMLWAEAWGLAEVLAGLKAYYLEWEHVILEKHPEAVQQLMTASPKLHIDLHAAMAKRARLQ